MPYRIQRAEYFYTTVRDEPGAAYRLLNILARLGVNLLAFTAVPVGPNLTQLTLFPEEPEKLQREGRRDGLILDGPHPAFLVQGDDELGALAEIHSRLFEANVNVYASTGVTDGTGSFGYIIYVRPKEFERALLALNL